MLSGPTGQSWRRAGMMSEREPQTEDERDPGVFGDVNDGGFGEEGVGDPDAGAERGGTGLGDNPSGGDERPENEPRVQASDAGRIG